MYLSLIQLQTQAFYRFFLLGATSPGAFWLAVVGTGTLCAAFTLGLSPPRVSFPPAPGFLLLGSRLCFWDAHSPVASWERVQRRLIFESLAHLKMSSFHSQTVLILWVVENSGLEIICLQNFEAFIPWPSSFHSAPCSCEKVQSHSDFWFFILDTSLSLSGRF